MVESVELATILVTDLVGSTRLATTVGPVRADELRDEHFGLLRQAIDSSSGREYKNTGDGLAVAFSSASAAVSCAALMQQLFERRYRRAEQQLHVRIGLGAGESTVQDGDYFGMPSIEAARLCDKAPTDGILVSPTVKMLAGRCNGVEFESAGELELKGIPAPMEPFIVLWNPLEDESGDAGGIGRWPLPMVLRSVPAISYVGRVAERELIEQGRVAARDGGRRVVFLSGEPGIGKTRLAAYAAHEAHAEGFAVCWGACSEDFSVPYEPWIEACSQLVEHAPDDLLAGYVERHGGELGRLARNLPKRVPAAPGPQSSDPDTERFLLFSAVTGLLRDASAKVPLCLVLDDLHWADGQSAALLKHVARTIEQGALQVIVTYRDSDLTKDHPLTGVLADLRRVEGVERVSLDGLGGDEVAQIMSAAAGHELDQDGAELAAEIADETGGNPFFVGEILLNLSESGMLVFDEESGRWSVDHSSGIRLPESVRDVIDRRVERLGPEAREILTVAAVIGRSFELELLTPLVDMSEGRLLDQLESAVAASLLAESTDQVGKFSFAHALINHTLYQSLGATRRARLHHRVAQALEKLCGADPGERLSELALHWRLATVSVDKSKAAGYSRRAGQRALESLAPAEAAKLFADALELIGNEDSRARSETLIGLGEAQRQLGDAAYRETLLEASRIASNLEHADWAARAALANNRGQASAFGQVDEERVAAIERALELDDPPVPARRASLLSLLTSELQYDPNHERRRELAEQALELAREAGDARTLAQVLRNCCYALWAPDTLERRKALTQELLDNAKASKDPALEFWAAFAALSVHVESGELERAAADGQRLRLNADQLGQPSLNWFARYPVAGLVSMQGELERAEQLALEAFEIGNDAGQADAIMIYGAVLTQVRSFQARNDEMLEMLEASVAANPGIPAWRAGLGVVYCWLGRHTDAAAIVEEAARDGFDHVPWDQIRTVALALYADAAAQAGVVDAAARLYELMEPWADQVAWNGANGYGHMRTYLGLLAATLGWDDRADEHFKFACEFHGRHDMPLWAARTRLGWAEALVSRGERARAQKEAACALELSRKHGYATFERRAAAIVEMDAPAQA